MAQGLRGLGLEPFVESEADRLISVNTVKVINLATLDLESVTSIPACIHCWKFSLVTQPCLHGGSSPDAIACTQAPPLCNVALCWEGTPAGVTEVFTCTMRRCRRASTGRPW